MKYASLSDTSYVLRLELGDDIVDSIQQFCANLGIANASVQGIGSVKSPKLAHYSIETKQFTELTIPGILEITSLLGNIALVEDRPLAHLHVTLSNEAMQTYGGHMIKGECSATLELIVTSYPSQHTKAHDDEVGLSVWQLNS